MTKNIIDKRILNLGLYAIKGGAENTNKGKHIWKDKKHPMLGKHQSEESKLKNRLSNLGKVSPRKGCHLLDTTKQKLRLIHLGKKLSDIQKKNISDGHKGLLIGEKNPMWQGGKSFEPYDINWNKILRRNIRERDKYTCMLCGDLQDKFVFSVHHIDYNKKNCNPDNLITLCKRCHAKTNTNRNKWEIYFKERLLCQ